MEGRIVTWHDARSFGFVRGGDGRDFFTHESEVIDPLLPLRPGVEVAFEVAPDSKGRRRNRAVNVRRLDMPAEGWGRVPATGVVSSWHEAFGFVEDEATGRKFYVNYRAIEADGYRELHENQRVTFNIVTVPHDGDHRFEARNVRPVKEERIEEET